MFFQYGANTISGDIRLEFFCPMFSVIRGPIRRNKDDFFGNPFMRDEQKGIWPFRKRECGQNRKPEIEKKKMLKIQEDC